MTGLVDTAKQPQYSFMGEGGAKTNPSRTRNGVFICSCCLLFLTVVFYRIGDRADFLPVFLDNGSVSVMEIRTLAKRPTPTYDTILSGRFQQNTEAYLSDNFPAHDKIAVLNAGLQRIMIAFSNTLFRFEAYSTFFGSSHIFHEESRSLFELPHKNTAGRIRVIRRNANAVVHLAQRHANLNFAVFFPNHSQGNSLNPAFDLMSEVDDKIYEECYLDIVSEYVSTDAHSFGSIDEWLEYYYATDHHWNIQGAYDGYRKIATMLGLEPIENPTEKITLKQDFYGSLSSLGRFLMEGREYLQNILFNYPDFEITMNDKPIKRNQVRGDLIGEGRGGASAVNYNYFGGMSDSLFRYRVEANEGKGCLLLISDSYANCIEPMLASHYEEMIVVHPLYNKSLPDIDEVIYENKVTDVAFVLGDVNITSPELRRFLDPKDE